MMMQGEGARLWERILGRKSRIGALAHRELLANGADDHYQALY